MDVERPLRTSRLATNPEPTNRTSVAADTKATRDEPPVFGSASRTDIVVTSSPAAPDAAEALAVGLAITSSAPVGLSSKPRSLKGRSALVLGSLAQPARVDRKSPKRARLLTTLGVSSGGLVLASPTFIEPSAACTGWLLTSSCSLRKSLGRAAREGSSTSCSSARYRRRWPRSSPHQLLSPTRRR